MNVQVARLSLLDGTRRAAYPEIGEVAAKRGMLYTLVEVSAPADEWDAVSRQLVDKAIEAFVVHKGPDTAALKEIAEALNEFLLETNADRTKEDAIWAGVNVVFMRETEMYLLQAGPALTYIARGTSVTRFPKSIDDSVFAPLGDGPEVEARLAKFALQADDTVAMTGSFLPSLVPEEQLSEVMRRGDVEGVTNGLAELAQTELSSLVLQYEPTAAMVDPADYVAAHTRKPPLITPPSKPAATPATPPAAKKDYSTNPPRPRAPRRQTPAEAAPAVTPRDQGPAAPEPSLKGRFARDDALPPAVEPAPADAFTALPPRDEQPPAKAAPRAKPAQEPPRRDEVVSGVARRVEPGEAAPRRKKAEPPRQPPPLLPMPPYSSAAAATMDAPAAPGAPPLLRQIGALLLALLGALLGGMAQLVAWISRSVAPRVASSGGLLDRLADGFWWVVDEVAMVVRRIMNQMLPGDRPDPSRPARAPTSDRGDGSAFLRTLVILIPLFFLIVAGGVWFFGGEESAPAFSINRGDEATFGSLLAEAQALIDQAANVDPETAQSLLARALPLLDRALPLAESDEQRAAIDTLRERANALLSMAARGSGVAPRPVVTFAAPLTATELVYGGNALYLIDPSRGALYRLLPDQPAVTDLAAIRPLLTAGERLAAGVDVGTPYQMTWIPAGGSRTGDGLLALTREGQMFDFDTSNSLLRQLAFASVTGDIVASEGYGGNLYYLDAGNRQIWKYVPDGGGEYPAAPEPWLNATGQSQFGTPIDMAIDGYIFVLDQSGEVRRFQVGEAKGGFALDAVNPPLTEPVALAKVAPETTDLFVADASRVLRFDQNGRFLREYRAAPGSDWGRIRDIAVDEVNATLYVLSDQGVYAVAVNDS